VAADQKRAPAESAWLVFFDESGISLIPPVRRTWSVRGRTPVLRHRVAWKRASMAAALGYRSGPDADGVLQARLCFHLQPDSYDTDSLIGVLEQLAGFYAGHKVMLLWDGLSAHWSHKMRAHLEQQRDWPLGAPLVRCWVEHDQPPRPVQPDLMFHTERGTPLNP
jgi:DDE superfamily endonuclease